MDFQHLIHNRAHKKRKLPESNTINQNEPKSKKIRFDIDPNRTLDEQQLIEKYLYKLGHKSFRSHQKQIINDVVYGKNVFVSMATGSGKSLCFQIAILVRNALHVSNCKPSIGIVISPLIALMSDQVNKLKQRGISAEVWNSSLSKTQRLEFIRNIEIGQIDIVYTTPESLLSKKNGIKDLLIQHRTVTTFCIDEAHCISMWGSSFRPSYFNLPKSLKYFGNPIIIACTATVPPTMRADIITNLKIENNVKTHISSSNRPNIELNITMLQSQAKAFIKALEMICEMHLKYDLTKNSVIVFGGMVKTTTEFYEFLRNEAPLTIIPALYHSKVGMKARNGAMTGFLNGSKNVMVATSGFGMGIDKHNVRCVIHLAIPPNPEEWAQQIGRAGRDGKQSHAYTLTYPEDRFAGFCVNKSCQSTVQETMKYLFAKYSVRSKYIDRMGDIYRKMNGIIKNKDNTNTNNMSDQEREHYAKYSNSMKILQRYGIVHIGGNYVYLMSKDTNHINWCEVNEIDVKNKSSFEEMQSIKTSDKCIRQMLLLYLGEEYTKSQNNSVPFLCCSNCNQSS